MREYVTRLEPFMNEQMQYDHDTLRLIEGHISFEEWEQTIDLISESVFDTIINKVMSVLKTVADNVKAAGKMGMRILKKIYGFVKGIMKKNPVLSKAILLIIVFLMFTVITAKAAATGGQVDLELVNTAIGYLDTFQSDMTSSFDIKDIMLAKGYLIDLKDGVIDDPQEWSTKVKAIGNAAITMVENMKDEGTDTTKFAERGFKLVDYIIRRTQDMASSLESITIIKK